MPPGKTATDFPLPDSFPSGLGRLPAGFTVEGATPDGEGRWCEHSGAPSPLPGGASAAKKMGRSLHQHPLPCGAPTRRRAGGCGDARGRRPTALYRSGLGESVPTRVQCGFPGIASTTAARAAPSDSALLWLPNACTTCVHNSTL